MKLHLVLCTAWWFLHTVQSASLDNYLKLKESNNALIQELALEALEIEDAHIEMPSLEESDIEDAMREEEYLEKLEMDDLLGAMAHNEDMDKEHFAYPSGKQGDRTTRTPGDHSYLGPYRNTFTNEQGCPFVAATDNSLTVAACEEVCDRTPNCSAFNWSVRSHLGCVLRDCGTGNPPFPNGDAFIIDWLSFSKKSVQGNTLCRAV